MEIAGNSKERGINISNLSIDTVAYCTILPTLDHHV
jgi:uncharacterized protein YjaG (DUF416 family)